MAIIPTLLKTIDLPYTSASSYFFKPPYLYAKVDGGTYNDPTCVIYRTNINTDTTTVVYSGGVVLSSSYMNFGAFFVYNDELYYLGTPTYYGRTNLNIVNLTRYTNTITTVPSASYSNYTYNAYILDNKVYFSHKAAPSGGTPTTRLYELNMDTLEVKTIISASGSYYQCAGYYGALTGTNKTTTPLPRTSSDYVSTGTALDRQLIKSGELWYSFKDGFFASIDINTLAEQSILNVEGAAPLYVPDTNKYLIVNKGVLTIYDLTDYRITYDFKDNEGNILSTLTDKPPITNINLNSVENGVTLVISFLDKTTQEVYFEVPQIEGAIFYGLNTVPNSKKAIITSGDNTVYISQDTTFYPVYQAYKPPSTVFQVTLYQNSAEPNRVDKTNYLTDVGSLFGAFREESSLVNMNIIIQQATIPSFNYVYISILNRYYYVTDIASVRYGLWRIRLEVDVLMTYKDAIRQCVGFCERNEFQFNDNIIDRNRVIEQGADVSVTPVTNELFTASGGSVVVQGFGLKSYTIE